MEFEQNKLKSIEERTLEAKKELENWLSNQYSNQNFEVVISADKNKGRLEGDNSAYLNIKIMKNNEVVASIHFQEIEEYSLDYITEIFGPKLNNYSSPESFPEMKKAA